MGREREREETLLRTREDWKEREEMAKGRSLLSKIWSLSSSQKAKTVSNWSNAFSLSASVLPPGVDDDATFSFAFVFVFVFLWNNPTPESPEEEETMERSADWTGVLYYLIFLFSFFFFLFWAFNLTEYFRLVFNLVNLNLITRLVLNIPFLFIL